MIVAEKTGISLSTAFRWRHKILDPMNTLPNPEMKAVIENLKINLKFSAKGSRKKVKKKIADSIVTAEFCCDRKDIIISSARGFGITETIPLPDMISRNSPRHFITIQSKASELKEIAKSTEINQIKCASSPNLVTAKAMNWMLWMKRFRGVATRYLPNYMNWYNFLSNSEYKTGRDRLFAGLLLS
jgi:hypothetical protein